MKSTSGLSNCPKNCRAYALKDSTYLRCPSAKIVSKAKLDLPEPDNPVKTTSEFLGISIEIFFKLCSRAPLTIRWSLIIRLSPFHVIHASIHESHLANAQLTQNGGFRQLIAFERSRIQ